MKKLLAVCLAAGILTITGCSADTVAGITEQSQFQRGEADSASQAEQTGTAAASASAAVRSAEQTGETHELSEPDEPSVTAETAETAEPVDPVKLVEALGSEYLGLPDSDKVYIYRNLNEQREINGERLYGVSCYDEGDSLDFICDIWVNSDGSRAYRQYGEDYRLLPESQAYSGFDPETQLPADIFAEANALYAAVYGELPYDQGSGALLSERGNYYRVTGQLDTKGKLNAALERFFTGDILDTLSEGSDNVIADEEGALYGLEHSGGNISYLGTEYTLTSLTDDAAVFTGTSRFEYEAGSITEKKITCRAVKTSTGWRFTLFRLPY